MKFAFNKNYLLVTLILLFIEVFIAFFVRDTFIRPFIGDLLSVILIYAILRIFIIDKRFKLVLAVLLFSFVIEFLQYFHILNLLGWQENKFLSIVLGATFDPLDLLAYSLGSAINLFLSLKKQHLIKTI
jgi:hypothetical protein